MRLKPRQVGSSPQSFSEALAADRCKVFGLPSREPCSKESCALLCNISQGPTLCFSLFMVYDLPWTSVHLSGSLFCLASIFSLHLTSLTAHLGRCDSSHPVLVPPSSFFFCFLILGYLEPPLALQKTASPLPSESR